MIEIIAHNMAPIMFLSLIGFLILGYPVDLVFGTPHAHFCVALMLQLRHGRHA